MQQLFLAEHLMKHDHFTCSPYRKFYMQGQKNQEKSN